MTRTAIGTICSEEQAAELNRARANQTPTAINAGAVAKLTRKERSLLYILLRDARDLYVRAQNPEGNEWAKIAQGSMEVVAKDGVDV